MVNLYDVEAIRKANKNVIDFIKTYSQNNKNSTDCLQRLQSFKPKVDCEARIFQLLLSYLNKAESVSAGGCEGFLAGIQNVEPNLDNFSLTISNLDSLLASFVDEHSKELLKDCFDMIGLHGKIVLSQHPVNGEISIVELNNSCYFPDLIPAFEIKSTKYLNPRLICIDGFIENVSEIHKILEDAATLKETIVLFVRGLSNEVSHTLKVNYDRGSLQVIPVIVNYDLLGANMLNDVAVINFSDVISSNKGQLINNINITDFARVEAVDITSTGTLIENSRAQIVIDAHIKRLQEKIINSSNQYESDILEIRIQNLGMNRITIRLKEEENKKLKSFEIDRAIRAIKDARTYGVGEINSKLLPYSGIKAGLFYAEKFLKDVEALGAIISS